MSRSWLLLALAIVLTAVAGACHVLVSDVAGSFASALPLILVAPLIAIGCDNLRGALSPSVLGIVQSAFGNAAELALTVIALHDNLPEVVRVAIAGSLLGNAILLGGVAGLLPAVRCRFRRMESLRFERRLFSSTATLSVIALIPIALLSFPTSGALDVGGRRNVSLAAAIALLCVGAFFIFSELRAQADPAGHGTEAEAPAQQAAADHGRGALSVRSACIFLASGAAIAALTSDWFVAGFEPAVERIGMPTAFASLVVIPFLGNVAENYVALRYAWEGDGDSAMAVIMHSVVQIALLVTGILLVVSRFVGAAPLTLRYDPVIAIALVLSMVVLWMIVHDGEITPVEAVGLLVTFGILGATVWAEGSI